MAHRSTMAVLATCAVFALTGCMAGGLSRSVAKAGTKAADATAARAAAQTLRDSQVVEAGASKGAALDGKQEAAASAAMRRARQGATAAKKQAAQKRKQLALAALSKGCSVYESFDYDRDSASDASDRLVGIDAGTSVDPILVGELQRWSADPAYSSNGTDADIAKRCQNY